MNTDWSGNLDGLPPNNIYQLYIDYLIREQVIFPIKVGKRWMSLSKLLVKIGLAYQNVYQNANHFGVYGHCIDDLYLEGIEVDHKKLTIKLTVGS